MSEKYLTKTGLSRLIEKLKDTFASLDSPKFKGSPTVETPTFQTMIGGPYLGKEVVNRAYVSTMYQRIINYLDAELNFHLFIKLKPEDWVYSHGVYVSDKLQHLSGSATVEHELSLFARIDYSKLAPSKAIEVYRNYPIEITQNTQIYLLGEKKPDFDLPVIIDAFISPDFTQMFGG